MSFLSIDIGGTWIKGMISIDKNSRSPGVQKLPIIKIKSRLHQESSVDDLISALKDLTHQLGTSPGDIKGVGISVPGIVNYNGTSVLKAASHINVLTNDIWINFLEQYWNCSISIINDSDAAAIGLAECSYLTGDKTIGIMPIGTGLGFTIWKNGRIWKPGKIPTLLGSIRAPGTRYDMIASASKLSQQETESHNLIDVLTRPKFHEIRDNYLRNLTDIINTAAILYSLDEIIICGGLADAVDVCGWQLADELNRQLTTLPPELDKPIAIKVAVEGNRLTLLGALHLAIEEASARKSKILYDFKALSTEMPYRQELQLQKLTAGEILEILWHAEHEASAALNLSLPDITEVANLATSRMKAGGRIIYVGAGTSGRLAAIDAVEIPCTFGFPKERIIAIIAGGVSDSAIEIESDYEEDASSVPEMLLLNIQTNDVVIGISASGSAYFVQSALSFAKSRGSLSIMIQAYAPKRVLPFWDHLILLQSGSEIIAGSTRMKAGTATKKILNFLSTTIMILLGNVAGPYMVNLDCLNIKLVKRAQHILKSLYGIEEEEALQLLKLNDMNLARVIQLFQK